jgi:hypothetical protein
MLKGMLHGNHSPEKRKPASASTFDARLHGALNTPWVFGPIDDLDLIAMGYEVRCAPGIATTAGVDPERFTLANARRAMMEAGDAGWMQPTTANLCLAMWVGDEANIGPRAPAGFIIAVLNLSDVAGQLVLAIDWQFTWLAPYWRGQGLGYHLAAHLAAYLADIGDRIDWAHPDTGHDEPINVTLYAPIQRESGLVRVVECELAQQREWADAFRQWRASNITCCAPQRPLPIGTITFIGGGRRRAATDAAP